MDPQTYLLFVITTAFIIFSPGPTAILIASQGAGNGLQRTLFGVLGITFATVIYFVMSATGIATLIVASNTLFQIIKWAGIAYLVYLGCTAIFSRSGGLVIQQEVPLRSKTLLFTHGFLIEFSNPKALIYFSAILPQFLELDKQLTFQFLIMWTTTFFLQCVIYSAYAYLGSHLKIKGVKSWIITAINKTAGGLLIITAIKMVNLTTNQ